MPIIAALSVVYLNSGRNRFQFLFVASWVIACRSPELADTPPAMPISLIPVSSAAFITLLTRILTIVPWSEAHRSDLFFSIKSGSFFRLSLRKYKKLVFSPLKLKSRPFIIGLENLKALLFPF